MEKNIFFTPKQQEMLFKRQRIVELRLKGLKHREIREQLNEELRGMCFKEVSLAYVMKYWNEYKNKI